MTNEKISHSPLYEPEKDGYTYLRSLEESADRARQVVEEKAGANIHDHDEMIRAAVGLHWVLRDLLAAIDEERRSATEA